MKKEDLLTILHDSEKIIFKERAIIKEVRNCIKDTLSENIKKNVIGHDVGGGRWTIEAFTVSLYEFSNIISIRLMAIIKEEFISRKKIKTRNKYIEKVKMYGIIYPYGWEKNYGHVLKYDIRIEKYDDVIFDLNFKEE